jgi:hypothetical protein
MFALADTKKAGGINKNVKSPVALGFQLRENLARQAACICSAQESGRQRWLYSFLRSGTGQSLEISAPDGRARHTDLDMVL